MQFLFGILLLIYVPSLDAYPGYSPVRTEALIDNMDYEPLPGEEHICPEREANMFSSEYIEGLIVLSDGLIVLSKNFLVTISWAMTFYFLLRNILFMDDSSHATRL